MAYGLVVHFPRLIKVASQIVTVHKGAFMPNVSQVPRVITNHPSSLDKKWYAPDNLGLVGGKGGGLVLSVCAIVVGGPQSRISVALSQPSVWAFLCDFLLLFLTTPAHCGCFDLLEPLSHFHGHC